MANGQGLTITIPEALREEKARPCEHAWAIRIPMQPRVMISRKKAGFMIEKATKNP